MKTKYGMGFGFAAVCAAMVAFAACGDLFTDHTSEKEEPVAVTANSISAKWNVSGSSSPYASFEFNEDGTYIVAKNSSVSADAYAAPDRQAMPEAFAAVYSSGAARATSGASAVYLTGRYTIDSVTRITLTGFGELEVINLYTSSFNFTVSEGGSTVTCEATRGQQTIASSAATELICHTWNVTALDNYPGLSAGLPSGYVVTITFTKYGTYMSYVKTSTGLESIQLAPAWSWRTERQSFSYTNTYGRTGTATISEFTASKIVFTDSANVTYTLER